MLLAFSKDLRVIMLRLASRLQTLRYFASSEQAVPASLAKEVFAGLRAARQSHWVFGKSNGNWKICHSDF